MTVAEAYRVIHDHLAERGGLGTIEVDSYRDDHHDVRLWHYGETRAFAAGYGPTLDAAVIDLAQQLKETT